MANVLPHKVEQAQAASTLGDEAQALGVAVISKATADFAVQLVKRVIEYSGGGPIGEAAGDVRVLRRDPDFNTSLNKDLKLSELTMTARMLEALEMGYRQEMDFQVTQIKGLSYRITDADRRDFADYPIQGHTCAEISRYTHDAIRYEVTGLLGAPLVGDSQVGIMPELLGQAAKRFGDRCYSSVVEAFYAGTQMALRGVATALGAT